MTLPYPYPQRAGRDRDIRTVDQSTFDGLPFRPTKTQAESLFRTETFKNADWYKTPFELQFSKKANIEESKAKAATIGGEDGGGSFDSIMDLISGAAKSVDTFRSIADEFIVNYKLKVQSITSGSPVPGNPPAPGEIHYTAAQREQLIKERIGAARGTLDSLVTQVKGLFNIGYPSSYSPPAPPAPSAPPSGLLTGERAKWVKYGIIIFIIYTMIRKSERLRYLEMTV